MVTFPTSVKAGYRFGPFVLDLRSGDLSRNGRPVRLQEKPRSLLLALAERRGELVSRRELHEHLWPEDTFVDFEDGLNAAMSKLREALDDDSQAPRYIETVRGRGYRFVAKVEVLGEEEEPAPEPAPLSTPSDLWPIPVAEQVSVPDTSRRPISRILVGVLSSLLLVAAALWFFHWRAVHARPISIAVLPFANMTGDASRDYISNGITEELIARLGHLAPGQLRVIAPASAEMYANSGKPTQQIGRELNVQYLIEGSLQQQGASIRVAAQLVRVDDQSRLWADIYKGDLSDQFAFEESVADSVGHALSLHVAALTSAEYRPGKYEAHDAYLKGLYFASQRTKSGFEQAVENFSNAVAIDPRYAAAYAQLADMYNLMGQYNWMNPRNAHSLAWAAAEQALSINPSLAEAHVALGFSDWYYQWDLTSAEAEFRKAIALEPTNVNAHHWYAQLLMTAGRFDEAEQQMQAALEADPRSRILRTNLGWLYEYEGRFAEAILQVRGVLAENPNFLNAHYKLWYIYSAMGDQTHASEEFQWVFHVIADPMHREKMDDLLRNQGYIAALKDFARSDDMEYDGSLVDGARCLASVGDSEGALSLLERAYQTHEGWMVYVQADPAFATLHSNPRFQQLLDQVRIQVPKP
ncbi:MAG TPA: winged helix-turn-helix domain-containing protein [Terracidiphilus sp.]|nr:winged helix-turn-helix domain-containing protein [Terracidiphilus sp.]